MANKGKEFLENAGIAALGVAIVLLSPIIVPFACVASALDRKKLLKAAETFRCVKCGQILGAKSVQLADLTWAQRMAAMSSDGILIRRIVRTLHALCTNCGAEYKYDSDHHRFELL